MSHSYGERPAPQSRVPLLRSSSTAPDSASNERRDLSPTLQPESCDLMDSKMNAKADTTLSNTKPVSFPLLSHDKLNCLSLTELRSCLREVVVQKQTALFKEREKLNSQRSSLIKQIVRLERAEQKSKDAARRVVIGRDVIPPPLDPVEKPWRKKRFGQNSRRSGPREPPKQRKKQKGEEGEVEDRPDQEIHSTRWKLKRKHVLLADAVVGGTEEWDRQRDGESEDFEDFVDMKNEGEAGDQHEDYDVISDEFEAERQKRARTEG